MAAQASDWLRHFPLLLLNCSTEFNGTWQEAKSHCPLPSLFFGGLIGKTRWPPWPPTSWDIFDFSETAEWNSTKLDRKQDFILLLLILCLSGRSENQDGRPGLWLAETFSTSSLKRPNGIQRLLPRIFHFVILIFFAWLTAWISEYEWNKPWHTATLCCLSRSEKQNGRPGLWLAETFSTSSLKLLNRIQRNLTGSKISLSTTKFVFLGADRKNKKAALASDYLRHFRLPLWNSESEFNKTWQEAWS